MIKWLVHLRGQFLLSELLFFCFNDKVTCSFERAVSRTTAQTVETALSNVQVTLSLKQKNNSSDSRNCPLKCTSHFIIKTKEQQLRQQKLPSQMHKPLYPAIIIYAI
jgi:hypothetical protein